MRNIINNFYWFINKLITGSHQIVDKKNHRGPFFVDDPKGLARIPQVYNRLTPDIGWWRDRVWVVAGIVYIIEKL